MKRIGLAVVMCASLALTGCTICKPESYGGYSAYGGRWERLDHYNGRVASKLSTPEVGRRTGGDPKLSDPLDQIRELQSPERNPRLERAAHGGDTYER